MLHIKIKILIEKEKAVGRIGPWAVVCQPYSRTSEHQKIRTSEDVLKRGQICFAVIGQVPLTQVTSSMIEITGKGC